MKKRNPVNKMMNGHRKCILMILDGWGYRTETRGNAVAQAKTPFLNQLQKTYPLTRLLTYGKAVGLPDGIMGNSEVGHLNIGAGRIVYQDLLRIDQAIEDGSFRQNGALNSIMSKVAASEASLHLLGLVSNGGVHSQLTHLVGLLNMARDRGLQRVYVHAILDGRDTSPNAGAGYVESLQAHLDKYRVGEIATICGRYYAMDRDKRWDRIQKAFQLYTAGEGLQETDPLRAVQNAYARKESDEFIKPIVMLGPDGKAKGLVRDGDGVLFFNFRADRAREITRAFTEKEFKEFDRKSLPRLCEYVCMTLYDESFNLPVAFGPVHLENILGEVISKNGLKQLRIAETEKYAHVTYFFNGGEEKPFKGEDRCLVPSPRDVPTYDHKPEMSAFEVTKEVIKRIHSDQYDLIVLNFANMDMVGHTGVMSATVKACEVVDQCVRDVIAAAGEKLWAALVTADHGNAEKMIDDDGNPHTAHTAGEVTLILVDDKRSNAALKTGSLCDIAPTILEIVGIDQPPEMTGRSLIS
jgi:2,3-bisphosphoglycerate-independent phosphoglycerate mutase